MAKVTETRCDRCEAVIDNQPYVRFIIQHHHPTTLDICRLCEGAFTLWLASGEELQRILDQQITGDGYPTAEQIEEYKVLHCVT